MKRGKILLFSRDPGAANTLIPLINPLKEMSCEVKLYGKEFALQQYSKFGFVGTDIAQHVKSFSQTCIFNFLKDENPNFIITGTSGEDFTERYIWQSAQELNIPTLAILDQWLNYGVRFSDFSTLDLDNENIKPVYVPAFIAVMDQQAKNELIECGVDASRVIITGHPYFEFLSQQKNKVTQYEVKSALGIGQFDIVITFASEPILRDYGGIDCWGYTERTIFESFVDALKTILRRYSQKITVIIKVHPRESLNYYVEFANHEKVADISFVLDQRTESSKIILASDIVCGISSMFLIEAALLNKPILSLQMGLKRDNPFILSRRGLVDGIYDYKVLAQKLEDLLINKKIPHYTFEFVKDSVNKIVAHVERSICQN
jgi:hypothetical protein